MLPLADNHDGCHARIRGESLRIATSAMRAREETGAGDRGGHSGPIIYPLPPWCGLAWIVYEFCGLPNDQVMETSSIGHNVDVMTAF